jgi:hypothetical protein
MVYGYVKYFCYLNLRVSSKDCQGAEFSEIIDSHTINRWESNYTEKQVIWTVRDCSVRATKNLYLQATIEFLQHTYQPRKIKPSSGPLKINITREGELKILYFHGWTEQMVQWAGLKAAAL